MRFDAVIFDLDGTLADTLDDIADAMNHALRLQDLPARPRDDYRELVGEGVARLVERALPPERQDAREAVLESLRDYYVAHMLDKSEPYPGVPDLLDRLAERRFPMAVLSNKPQEATRWMVERLFGRWAFAAVLGESPDVPRKPDPAGAVDIARAIGAPPERCLYLGDTRTDMQTAVAAGMYPVGALWGFRDRDELVGHGARAVIAEPLELLDVLEDGA